MKKALFILAFIMLTSFVVKSQNTENYYLPDFIDVEYCSSLSFYDTTSFDTQMFMARNHYYFYATGRSQGINQRLDRAQPCYTDTLLTVQGIAIGVNNRVLIKSLQHAAFPIPSLRVAMIAGDGNPIDIEFYSSTPKGKLRLMNNTLNREIISVDIDTNFVLQESGLYSYIEYYFSTPVNVNGLFYIVEDITTNSTQIPRMVFSECNFEYPSLVRTAEKMEGDTIDTTWMQWSEHPYNQDLEGEYYSSRFRYSDFYNLSHALDSPIPNTCQMYMFPIFAETDTTLGDGTYPDTNVCLYDVNVERYSNVYPNPAKDIVTVQSSFKVKEIEIHNALGQVVLRKEGNQNIETIEVNSLEKGTYIVRIKTQRGFANKKLVIK
ncbi:MAG: T9SS type A sorting domain-containing protein [Bacteroidales bacterium]|nr:T9SS type A sorting domain-containing protein [Bacteroidales bacterium]